MKNLLALVLACLSTITLAAATCPQHYAHVNGIYQLFDHSCYVKGDLYCPRNITYRLARTCPPDLPFTCAALLGEGNGKCAESKQEAMRLGCDSWQVVTCKGGMLQGS